MIINPVLGALAGLALLLVIRVELVSTHRNFILNLMRAVGEAFLEDCRRTAEREEKTIPEEEKEAFYAKVSDKMSRVHDITKTFKMYPSFTTLVFSLNKWTREQMYPYIELNMALAMAGKIDDIDKDLLE